VATPDGQGFGVGEGENRAREEESGVLTLGRRCLAPPRNLGGFADRNSFEGLVLAEVGHAQTQGIDRDKLVGNVGSE
jgi:hypothetical protein